LTFSQKVTKAILAANQRLGGVLLLLVVIGCVLSLIFALHHKCSHFTATVLQTAHHGCDLWAGLDLTPSS